jgi:hypothetical protein
MTAKGLRRPDEGIKRWSRPALSGRPDTATEGRGSGSNKRPFPKDNPSRREWSATGSGSLAPIPAG